ncbi:MAG: peptide-methionine (S)-S-oxide reductase [Bacteroidetes bacterium]|nr:MAG: peptide-methionine (S)-S-oxide reductase [Bacteroidota bacterium]
MRMFLTVAISSIFSLLSCAQKNNTKKSKNMDDTKIMTNLKTDTATFGTGCFWCTEAVFQELEGVLKVTSGYSGGSVPNPTYEQVCSKTTGHAEVCQIVYDPSKITFDELLEVFWKVHDPTTLNRQGNDVGPQYRSVVFYHNDAQKQKAEHYKEELGKSGAWDNPIVTAIEPFRNFYAAEDYHQNYFNNNGNAPYCYFVIRPKVEKFEKVFKSKLKASAGESR